MFDCLLRLAYRSVHLSVYLIGLPVLCGQKVRTSEPTYLCYFRVCVCVCVCARARRRTILKREARMGPGPPAVACVCARARACVCACVCPTDCCSIYWHVCRCVS